MRVTPELEAAILAELDRQSETDDMYGLYVHRVPGDRFVVKLDGEVDMTALIAIIKKETP